ncbi:MAG TPA: hypothetical protein VK864_15160 [Longimicrobiales bacterium]|nr:hypothetical protein [Longimicrobiales bacterium]
MIASRTFRSRGDVSERLRVLGLPLLQIDARFLACQLLQLRSQHGHLTLPPEFKLMRLTPSAKP